MLVVPTYSETGTHGRIGGAGASRLVDSGVVGTGQSSWTNSGGILKLITDIGDVLVFFCEETMFKQGAELSKLVGRQVPK